MDRLLNIASLSYGKDSLAQLEIMHRNGIPIDGILTADIWATKEIPAYLPELADFRNRMDYEIEKRYGRKVTHAKASKTFEECFFRERSSRSQYEGIWGWPPVFGPVSMYPQREKYATGQNNAKQSYPVTLGTPSDAYAGFEDAADGEVIPF